MPNNQIYSFIEFRVSDILDLKVIEDAPPPFQDPAIVSSSAPEPALRPHLHKRSQPHLQPTATAPAVPDPPAPETAPVASQPTAIKRRPAQARQGQQQDSTRRRQPTQLVRTILANLRGVGTRQSPFKIRGNRIRGE